MAGAVAAMASRPMVPDLPGPASLDPERVCEYPEKKPSVPPLRFAPVGMTILSQGQVFLAEALTGTTQNCHPDRSGPGFPISRCWQRPRLRFPLRKPHDVDQRHGSRQEIRGSVVE